MILLTGTDKTINACKCGKNPTLCKRGDLYEIVCEYYHCNNPFMVMGTDLDKVIDLWNSKVVKV